MSESERPVAAVPRETHLPSTEQVTEVTFRTKSGEVPEARLGAQKIG